MTYIFLIAGKGNRLQPLTLKMPKSDRWRRVSPRQFRVSLLKSIPIAAIKACIQIIISDKRVIYMLNQPDSRITHSKKAKKAQNAKKPDKAKLNKRSKDLDNFTFARINLSLIHIFLSPFCYTAALRRCPYPQGG